MSIITDTVEGVDGALLREVTGKSVTGNEGLRSVLGVGGFSGIG